QSASSRAGMIRETFISIAGGLEGCKPSKIPLFPARSGDTQRVPGRRIGRNGRILGRLRLPKPLHYVSLLQSAICNKRARLWRNVGGRLGKLRAQAIELRNGVDVVPGRQQRRAQTHL